MVYEDVVECEHCGAEITHLQCGRLDTKSDPDYYVCQSCVDERDGNEDETDETCPHCGEKGVPYGAHCNMVDHE